MADVFSVAKYILHKQGKMTLNRLNYLVYYSQAWTLAWDGTPLFSDRIEAWSNGAIIPVLYKSLRKKYNVTKKHINRIHATPALTKQEKSNIKKVIKFYNKFKTYELFDIIWQENPWMEARSGLQPLEHGGKEITASSMLEYYTIIQIDRSFIEEFIKSSSCFQNGANNEQV